MKDLIKVFVTSLIISMALAGIILFILDSPAAVRQPPYCFTQVERKDGWEQQEITCKYRDSATHEWKTFRYMDIHFAKDTLDPFSLPRRRRIF